jgi:ABC-2 type transport system permease protein
MMMPLAVYALFMVQGMRMGQDEVSGEAALLILSAFVLFLAISMVSRLGLGGIGSEGRQIWLLKTAPVPPRRVLWGKFMSAYLPYLVLGGLMVLGMALVNRLDWAFALGEWLLLAIIGLGALGIGVGLGASFPRFEVARKRQNVSPGAGCLYFPIVMLYTLIVVGLLLVPPLLDSLLRSLGAPIVATILWIVGPAGAIVLTAVALFLPLRIGAERLARLEV